MRYPLYRRSAMLLLAVPLFALALGGCPGIGILDVTPSLLDFGESETTLNLTINQYGLEPAPWNTEIVPTSANDWLSIDPATGEGSVEAQVSVDRGALSQASGQALIMVRGQVNEFAVKVTVQGGGGGEPLEGEPSSEIIRIEEACREEGGEDAETDEDGDGLNRCVEGRIGTSDDEPDSDGDGMPDGWEVGFGLDPTTANDGGDDDLDGLENVEEFLRGSSPVDANDPGTTVFVSPAGEDAPFRGTLEEPYATINFALQETNSTLNNPVRISLADGDYAEDVRLALGVTLASQLDNPNVRILGAIEGNDGTVLEFLTVAAPEPLETLLTMNRVSMRVTGVVFVGGPDASFGTGILTDGESPGTGVIEQCVFEQLEVGIDVGGDLPLIRRCHFVEPGTAAIVIRSSNVDELSNTLGNAFDPKTARNTFEIALNKAGAAAVVNERTTPILMENNDWSTDYRDEIRSLIKGPTDFDPYLLKGTGLLSASLFCTLWDAQTQARIDDGALTLAPSSYVPVRANLEGVYAFPSIGDGSYTITARASGFTTRTTNVLIQPAAVQSLSIPLWADGTQEAKCGGKEDGKSLPADFFIGALSLVVLLLWRRQ